MGCRDVDNLTSFDAHLDNTKPEGGDAVRTTLKSATLLRKISD